MEKASGCKTGTTNMRVETNLQKAQSIDSGTYFPLQRMWKNFFFKELRKARDGKRVYPGGKYKVVKCYEKKLSHQVQQTDNE